MFACGVASPRKKSKPKPKPKPKPNGKNIGVNRSPKQNANAVGNNVRALIKDRRDPVFRELDKSTQVLSSLDYEELFISGREANEEVVTLERLEEEADEEDSSSSSSGNSTIVTVDIPNLTSTSSSIITMGKVETMRFVSVTDCLANKCGSRATLYSSKSVRRRVVTRAFRKLRRARGFSDMYSQNKSRTLVRRRKNGRYSTRYFINSPEIERIF